MPVVVFIIGLLFRDITRIVIIAVLIVLPITYWAYFNCLESFAYQEKISYFILAMVAILSLIIAFGTISFHSFRLANCNPVESLRRE